MADSIWHSDAGLFYRNNFLITTWNPSGIIAFFIEWTTQYIHKNIYIFKLLWVRFVSYLRSKDEMSHFDVHVKFNVQKLLYIQYI